MKMYHAFQPYMQYKSTYSIINNIACVLKISLMKNNPLLKELRESTDTQIRPVNCSTSGKRTAIYSSAPNHTSKYSVWWYVDHCLSFWAKPLHCMSFELRFSWPLWISSNSPLKKELYADCPRLVANTTRLKGRTCASALCLQNSLPCAKENMQQITMTNSLLRIALCDSLKVKQRIKYQNV